MDGQVTLQEVSTPRTFFKGILVITASSSQLTHSNNERNPAAACQIVTRPDLCAWLNDVGFLSIYNLSLGETKQFVYSRYSCDDPKPHFNLLGLIKLHFQT